MFKNIRMPILWLFPLTFAIIFITIGYASFNSITAEITGNIYANMQTGVFISNVELINNIDADLNMSNIDYYKGTMMQSSVKLSDTNPNSEIEYKVTVYNNSQNSYHFLGVIYDQEWYNNPDIVFEITGFNIGEVIHANETKEINIIFKYKDEVIPLKTELSSYLNFKISTPNRLRLAQSSQSDATYLNSNQSKSNIEQINFKLGQNITEGIIESFDASENQDNSIIGYYTDTDNNGLYELTFASDELIVANENSQYLFENLTNISSNNFTNFSTIGVINMQGMFSGCSSLSELDVSNFNTNEVKQFGSLNNSEFGGMFNNCSSLNSLDLSNWNTSKAENFSGMFFGCKNIESINLNNFDTSKATNMQNMFYNCNILTNLDVSNFNTSNVTTMHSMFYGCKRINNNKC